MGDAGDERREGDEEDGREQQLRAGRGARACLGGRSSSGHTAAVQIDLEEQEGPCHDFTPVRVTRPHYLPPIRTNPSGLPPALQGWGQSFRFET